MIRPPPLIFPIFFFLPFRRCLHRCGIFHPWSLTSLVPNAVLLATSINTSIQSAITAAAVSQPQLPGNATTVALPPLRLTIAPLLLTR